MKLLLLILFFFTILSCNPKAFQNEEDIKKILIDMKYDQVDSIMRNRPFKYRNLLDKNATFFEYYKSPFGYSDHFIIEYNKKDSIVVDVWYGD